MRNLALPTPIVLLAFLLLAGCSGASTFVLQMPQAGKIDGGILVRKVHLGDSNLVRVTGKGPSRGGFDTGDARALLLSLAGTFRENKVANARIEGDADAHGFKGRYALSIQFTNVIIADSKAIVAQGTFSLADDTGKQVAREPFVVAAYSGREGTLKTHVNRAIVHRIITSLVSAVEGKQAPQPAAFESAAFFQSIEPAFAKFPTELSTSECVQWVQTQYGMQCQANRVYTLSKIEWKKYVMNVGKQPAK